MHRPVAHVALDAVVVSHVLPQPAQFVVVVVGVSQPSRSVPALSQSSKPALHPVYSHVPPTHAPPIECASSQPASLSLHGASETAVSRVSAASGASGASVTEPV